MAVFTPVTDAQLATWLDAFDLGRLVSLEGIASGIENTNYFVGLERDGVRREVVLTLFERLSAEQLPFYLGLMKHLAARGIAAPDPLPDRQGRLLGTLNGKPAALVSRLPGSSRMDPGPDECRAVGRLLARMHFAATDYPANQANLRGLRWWIETAPKVEPFLDSEQARLLAEALAEQRRVAESDAYRRVPRSAVHADLFRDNVLFDEGRLGGVIDFYFAGVDTWMFDLAVTCNDWCIDEATGAFDDARLQALLEAYRTERTPEAAERTLWPAMLRAAALRFWLSRLFDLHLPRPAEMVTPKDPGHFERVLRQRLLAPLPIG